MIARIRPGDEVVGRGGRAAADERDERERAGEPLLGRQQLRARGRRSPTGRTRPTAPRPAGRPGWSAACGTGAGTARSGTARVATATGTPMMQRDRRRDQRADDAAAAPWKMLRETSQSLPKTKLSPNVLNVSVDWPIRRMKKYDDQGEDRARRARSDPTSGSDPGDGSAADRSRTERPAVTSGGAGLHLQSRSSTRSPTHCRSSSPAARCPWPPATDGSGAYGSWLEPAPSVCWPGPNA